MNIFLNRSILPINGALKGTTPLGQNGPRNNGIKRAFHIYQMSRTGALLSEAVCCHTHNILVGGGGLPSAGDTVSVFSSPGNKMVTTSSSNKSSNI